MSYQIQKIKTRLKFILKLILSPKFYELIGEPLQDLAKLDLTLGTVCYGSLFLTVLIKNYPKLHNIITQLRQTLTFHLKNSFRKIIRKALLLLKLLVNKIHNNITNSSLKSILAINENYIDVLLEKTDKNSFKSSKSLNLPSNELSPTMEHIRKSLRELSSYITDVRMFYRTFQIPQAISDLISAPPALWKEKDYINLLSTISICLYQPFETVAFGLDKGWLLPNPEGGEKCGWWYITSTKFWFAWVLVEFGYTTMDVFGQLHTNFNDAKRLEKSSVSKRIISAIKSTDGDKWVKFIEHFSTLPLCVHWSTEDGCLDDLGVGLFGTLAGGVSTFFLWKEIGHKIVKEFA